MNFLIVTVSSKLTIKRNRAVISDGNTGIQQLTKSNQNFFLHQGFGSLDKDALAIVFNTLKNLRKENGIVGVISLINEMQQEIQVNLQVTNDSGLGSLIKNSCR